MLEEFLPVANDDVGSALPGGVEAQFQRARQQQVIGIQKNYPFAFRRSQAAVTSCRDPAIGAGQDADRGLEGARYPERIIRRAIVHDCDLEIGAGLGERACNRGR